MSATMIRLGVPALVAFGAIVSVGNPAKADPCNNRYSGHSNYSSYSYVTTPSYGYVAAPTCSTPVVVRPIYSAVSYVPAVTTYRPTYYSAPRTVTYYSRPSTVIYRSPIMRYYPSTVRYYPSHTYRPSHSGFSFGISYNHR